MRFGRRLLAFGLCVALVACRCGQSAGDEAPTDPARIKLVQRLGDGRPMVRATAMKELGPEATKYEVFAIARAAKAADEIVRIAAAESLGLAAAPESVDLLSAFLLDPLDTVRAVAVESLARKADAKARALVASAYEKGGPRTRAAVADAGTEALSKGLALETSAIGDRIDAVLHFDTQKEPTRASRERRIANVPQPNSHAKALAIGEMARTRGEAATDVFVSFLEAKEPELVVAAIDALSDIRAIAHEAKIVALVTHPQPAVAEAAARALSVLAPGTNVATLVTAMARGDAGLSRSAWAALGDANVEGHPSLCEIASQSADLALAAAVMRRAACPLPSVPLENGSVDARTWTLLRALDVRGPEWLAAARLALADRDGLIASTAALYLATQGEASDAARLATMALVELDLVAGGREVARAAESAAIKEAVAPEAAFLDAVDSFGALTNGTTIRRETALTKLIEQRRFTRESLSFEVRPGSAALIASASAGAARLGGDISAVVEALLASAQPALRRLAVDAADLAVGESGEAMREKVRASEHAELRALMAVRDFSAGRPGAAERLVAIAPKVPDLVEIEVAEALAKAGEPAREELRRLVDEAGAAAVPAMAGLAKLKGDDVDQLLSRESLSASPPLARAAVLALEIRADSGVQAIARAATHPDPSVREAALSVLARRHACGPVSRLAPLVKDVDREVRLAAARFAQACPPAP